jgi:hypothetical protein
MFDVKINLLIFSKNSWLYGLRRITVIDVVFIIKIKSKREWGNHIVNSEVNLWNEKWFEKKLRLIKIFLKFFISGKLKIWLKFQKYYAWFLMKK